MHSGKCYKKWKQSLSNRQLYKKCEYPTKFQAKCKLLKCTPLKHWLFSISLHCVLYVFSFVMFLCQVFGNVWIDEETEILWNLEWQTFAIVFLENICGILTLKEGLKHYAMLEKLISFLMENVGPCSVQIFKVISYCKVI